MRLLITAAVLLLGLSACKPAVPETTPETPRTAAGQAVADSVAKAEKLAIESMLNTLNVGISSHIALAQGTPSGFSDFVGQEPGSQCGQAACSVFIGSYASQNAAGRQCRLSASQIDCTGVFQYYDPVIFHWNQGRPTVSATPHHGVAAISSR